MAPYHCYNHTSTANLSCPVCKTPILVYSLPPKSGRRQSRNAQWGQFDVNSFDESSQDRDNNNNSNINGGSLRDDEERQNWAHVQLIYLAVQQSRVERVQQVLEDGRTPWQCVYVAASSFEQSGINV